MSLSGDLSISTYVPGLGPGVDRRAAKGGGGGEVYGGGFGVWRWFGSTPAGVKLGAMGCFPERRFGAASLQYQ